MLALTRSLANRPPNLEIVPADIIPQPRDDSRRNLRKAEDKFTGAARNDIGKAIIDSATDDISCIARTRSQRLD
jgi:hypothetical protein